MKRSSEGGLMLVQRRRRWPSTNANPQSDNLLMSAGCRRHVQPSSNTELSVSIPCQTLVWAIISAKGGYVFVRVWFFLSDICLFVCPSVRRITYEVRNGFAGSLLPGVSQAILGDDPVNDLDRDPERASEGCSI